MKRKYVAKGFIDTCMPKLIAHVSQEMNERIISSMRSTFFVRFAGEMCLPRASIAVDAIGNMRPNTNRYTLCVGCETHGTVLCRSVSRILRSIANAEEYNMEC